MFHPYTSRKVKVFWRFQGIKKLNIGIKWVNLCERNTLLWQGSSDVYSFFCVVFAQKSWPQNLHCTRHKSKHIHDTKEYRHPLFIQNKLGRSSPSEALKILKNPHERMADGKSSLNFTLKPCNLTKNVFFFRCFSECFTHWLNS